MEIIVYVWNALRTDEDGLEKGVVLNLPINEDEVRERLGFHESMEGYHVTTADGLLCDEIQEDMEISELNQLYQMLEDLEGKVHEDDIWAVKKQWFSNLKEMCENISFVTWILKESAEETARKSLEHYAGYVPDALLKSVDVHKYADALYADDQYLITPHGVYSFDEPVY